MLIYAHPRGERQEAPCLVVVVFSHGIWSRVAGPFLHRVMSGTYFLLSGEKVGLTERRVHEGISNPGPPSQ